MALLQKQTRIYKTKTVKYFYVCSTTLSIVNRILSAEKLILLTLKSIFFVQISLTSPNISVAFSSNLLWINVFCPTCDCILAHSFEILQTISFFLSFWNIFRCFHKLTHLVNGEKFLNDIFTKTYLSSLTSSQLWFPASQFYNFHELTSHKIFGSSSLVLLLDYGRSIFVLSEAFNCLVKNSHFFYYSNLESIRVLRFNSSKFSIIVCL